MPMISFDLDHTLMINPFRRWVFPQLETWLGPRLQADTGTLFRRLGKEHQDRLNRRMTVEAYDWDAIWFQLAREAGEEPPFSVEELVRHHAVPGKVWLFSDALPVLEMLKSKGIRLAVATNGLEKYQRPVTDCLGLTPFFDDYHTPCSRGCAKPETSFFDSCTRPLIHVGDRLDHDVLGANRAGAVSVWINRDLPAEWWGLTLEERKYHPDWHRILQEKLKKEGFKGELTPELEPDYTLVSLEELPALWEKERTA